MAIYQNYKNNIIFIYNIMNKFVTIILLSILIMIFIYIITNKPKKTEPFEIVLGDPKLGIISKVHLQHFFQFVEYYQTEDLNQNQFGSLNQEKRFNLKFQDEGIYIRNNVTTLLKMLNYIVNVNEKDNYYSRFLVIKVGSNLEYSKKFTFRRQNYDELVRGKVGKQFTFLPQNEYDLYAPRASHESSYQYPLPDTINVHDYYKTKNIELNLMALKMLLERVHGDDPNSFKEIFHPTEHPNFLSEFMIPLKLIKNNILHIVNTDTYKQYLKTHKHSANYKDRILRIDEPL
jgi:hypothetical protein